MSVTIDRQSVRVIQRIENMSKLTKAGVEFAGYTSAKSLIRTINKEILRKPKSGRTYIRRDKAGRRRRHVASAPGETHANMTGTLRKTLSFKVNVNELEYGYGVTKNDAPEYAEKINNTRPGLALGATSERRNFQNNFESQIGKRLGASLA